MMFKNLRNRFLIINVATISVVMIIAFAIIYSMIYSNIQTVNKSRIDSVKIADRQLRPAPSIQSSVFLLVVNNDGKIEDIRTPFHLPDEAYQKAAESAWNKQKSYSTLKIDNREWMYVIRAGGNEDGISAGENLIVFLDVTESNQTLRSYFTVFLTVGFFMLIVITAISFYFANRVIKPIKTAWDKQEQFITDASHELKTPLTIINSNYDVLLSNREETIDSQMKWMERIRSGADRMSMLVSSLLTLAKMGNADVNISDGMFNFSGVITEALQEMEALINEKAIRLTTEIKRDIAINSDIEMVKQVILILLDNAAKYTDTGGWMDVTLSQERNYTVFTVKNSGKGISAEELPKLFDRFYRGDKSRKTSGGFGLGLSIAKTITDRLGGKLTADSV